MKYFMNAMMLVCCICWLAGCAASTPKCTNVALYDYDNDEWIQAVHWFQADYYDHPFIGFDGLAVTTKYLGQGAQAPAAGCKNPAELNGWYSVNIPIGQGTYVLVGKGWGNSIDVTPNSISQKNMKRITENSLDNLETVKSLESNDCHTIEICGPRRPMKMRDLQEWVSQFDSEDSVEIEGTIIGESGGAHYLFTKEGDAT